MYYIGEISEGEYGGKIIELWNDMSYTCKQAKIELSKLIKNNPNLQIIKEDIVAEYQGWE